jgi:cyclopropane fatty-acyl-phospholipid synthase-like methyltransferase
MPFDPVDQIQQFARRAGGLAQRRAPEATRLDALDESARARVYEGGRLQVANLAERIRIHTGESLDGRTALDFGCGVGRMSLALAEFCEHVVGLDVSPAVLREADREARRRGRENVEWGPASSVAGYAGRYDLVVSLFVFQHIPSREGERIFETILKGLRPGGVGAVDFTLRPSGRRIDLQYLYMLTNSYSLDRLASLLARNGVATWDTRWHTRSESSAGGRTYDAATLVFRKDD